MKTLILTVSTGQGHNSAARAIENQLTESGCECKVVDVYYSCSKILGYMVSQAYLLSVDALSGSYSKIYNKLEKRKYSPRSAAKRALSVISKKLHGIIDEYKPDVIVCTHVFACIPVVTLKEKGLISAKTIGIVTDFTLHPYWEEVTKFDYIVIPSERLTEKCRKKGFSDNQLLPFGIPIHPKFNLRADKAQIKASLELYNKPVILIMGGSMGYGDISGVLSKIDKVNNCFQIIVVCGSNVKELNKIRSRSTRHKVLSYGYTDNINLLMDAADFIVTKPGGISVSEALAKELPMILTKPIPGHEERNVSFLVDNGVAMTITENTSAGNLITQFLSDREQFDKMTNRCKDLSKPDSTERLCEFIINLCNGYTK